MSDITILLAAVPGIEAMWTSVYLICSQRTYLIPVAFLLNLLSVFVFIKLLDASKLPSIAHKIIEKKLSKRIHMIENWFNKYGQYAVLILIGLPSTGIGSFSGAFIARTFGISGIKLYLVVSLGIIISLVPAFLISYGIDILGIKC